MKQGRIPNRKGQLAICETRSNQILETSYFLSTRHKPSTPIPCSPQVDFDFGFERADGELTKVKSGIGRKGQQRTISNLFLLDTRLTKAYKGIWRRLSDCHRTAVDKLTDLF